MYCRKCGRMIADDAAFCSYCGTPTAVEPVEPEFPSEPVEEVAPAPEVPVAEPAPEEIVSRKPIFDEFQWNVNDYPDNTSYVKTEDVNFDWNADPNEIRDRYSEQPEDKGFNVEDIVPGGAPQPVEEPDFENMSAADRIDKFYTFNRKNEEFQELLNKEYQKVKAGSAIGYELSEADTLAEEKFEHRQPDNSMDAFLRREGVERPYEPKPFESDVLARIEAQEEAREIQRREEEARQAALEQARKEAEEKMRLEAEARIRAEEEARIKAEEAFKEAERLKEEARLRAEEVAKFKAEEEARLQAEEEARARAEEEARLQAEEEARIRAQEEARAKAEAEAARAAEERAREEARAKAEAEYAAAMEAEKIKSQIEARQAAEAIDRERAEQERRKAEEERIRARLEEEQANLARKADNAAMEEEARKVLEQTAKMREAEAEKIRAAIAGIKGEIASKPEPKVEEPTIKFDEPLTDVEELIKPAEPVERPTAQNPFVTRRETVAPEPVQFASTVAIQRGDEEIAKAQQATRDRITKMAQAREDFFAGFEPEEKTPVQPPVESPAPAPAPAPEVRPTTGRNTMLMGDSDLTRTRAIDKADILAGMEKTRRLEKAEMNAKEDKEFFDSLKEPEETVEDLLTQLETEPEAPAEEPAVLPVEEAAVSEFAETPEETLVELIEETPDAVEEVVEITEEPAAEVIEAPAEPEIPEEGFAVKEEPTSEPDAEASEEQKPGLEDTMIMPESEFAKADLMSEFDKYGEEEAARLRAQQEAEKEEFRAQQAAEAAAAEAAAVEEEPATDKASKKAKEKADKAAEKAKAKEEKAKAKEEKAKAKAEKADTAEKGGKGRVVLKVILVLLIIIFALELAGIGIKFLAPQSGAAETIDNQLNKIIHLITGEETTSDDIIIMG